MKCKVWNDNTHPYSEDFKGEAIKIPAGKFVEMNKDDAILFMGQMNSIERTADGNPHPRSFKKLRREDLLLEDKKAEDKKAKEST